MASPSDISGILANKWLGLVAASAGMFLTFLDITVNVALPTITQDFSTDVQTVQWIIIFYVGSTTGLQLGLGSAADTYGLKRFFIIGIGIYTVAVLLIGLAPSLSIVFGLRVLQALGNGLILASTPALVTSIFPPEERGRGLGLMTGLATIGMIAGALGGGFLVDSFGWRAIFLARVPLGLLAIVLAFAAIKVQHNANARKPFDLRGASVLFVSLTSFILFLTLGGRIGWGNPITLALILLSLTAFAILVSLEKKVNRPVLDLSLLRHRVLSPVIAVSYLMYLATFLNWFILPFFVSDVLGANAKTWGFLIMLMPVASAVVSPIGGWLSDRMAPAYLTTLALAIASGAIFWFSTLTEMSSVTDIAFRMVVIGVAIGMFQASSASLIMGTVPGDRLGTGGAILSISRSMGTVSSVAIMSALFASRLDTHSLTAIAQDSAFVMAFKDTYLVSGVLAIVAAIISISYWPQMLRRYISSKAKSQANL